MFLVFKCSKHLKIGVLDQHRTQNGTPMDTKKSWDVQRPHTAFPVRKSTCSLSQPCKVTWNISSQIYLAFINCFARLTHIECFPFILHLVSHFHHELRISGSSSTFLVLKTTKSVWRCWASGWLLIHHFCCVRVCVSERVWVDGWTVDASKLRTLS